MPPKPKLLWSWIKKDKEFIKMMEQYENNETFSTKGAKQKEVWRDISIRVGMPVNYCRRKWTGMKHNYLKLKYMIHFGNVTEDMVRKHVKTSKYLDGSLDFLDRYMFKIPEAELSSIAHNFFDSVFSVPSYKNSGSSVEKLIQVKENSVLEVIKDYKQEKGTEPISILPNIDNYESGSSITHFKEAFVNSGSDEAKDVNRIDDDSNDKVFVEPDIKICTSVKEEFVNLGMDEANEVNLIDDDSNDKVFVEPAILPDIQISTTFQEEFVNVGMDQAIKEGYRIRDGLNDEQFVAPDMLPNIQMEQADPIGDNVVTTDTNSSILKDILMSTKNEETKSTKPSSEYNCDLARFLVKYANTTIDREMDEDCNLKKYMYDLAEVLCKRLVPGKRKYFLSRVDLIVSEILEGT